MTFASACIFLASIMVAAGSMMNVLMMKELLSRHEAALATMRQQLRIYEAICSAQGDAEHLFVRHQKGTDSTWVDIVLTIPGLSLRMPIRPEEMDAFIAQLRG